MKIRRYLFLFFLLGLTCVNAWLCIWMIHQNQKERKTINTINKSINNGIEKNNENTLTVQEKDNVDIFDNNSTGNESNAGSNDNRGIQNNSKEGEIFMERSFYYEPISEELKKYITGKSYQENDTVSYDDLRHVVVQYIGFDGQSKSGELIVNTQVADDVVEIFKELYENQYPIEKIRLVDEYNADDDASMADNNTSAFNYRVIDGTNELSDHGYGIAIDINPLYNPYVRTNFGDRNVLPVNAAAYADRTAVFEHKIEKGDVCYNAFISRGWKWGGEWESPVDYQHFYKELS